MKRAGTLLAAMLLAVGPGAAWGGQAGRAPAQKSAYFYNVDTERRVEGVVQEVLFEPRYEDRAPFLILLLEEKKTGNPFKVELSPAWFFGHDLHKGEPVKIVGSFYAQDNESFIIARELRTGGETFKLRDSRGFPNWRGGPMKGKGRRRGQGM